MKEIKRDLAAIEYELFIGNSSVTVRKFESEPDYGAAVAATFEQFKQGAVKDYEFKLVDFFEMKSCRGAHSRFRGRAVPRLIRTPRPLF